ncbi:MAG: HU family DNA-binding protein [Selenomonadaceae bacterium]|nr:HU family DNA-binding protein [Selenomonadaceae bacterium]
MTKNDLINFLVVSYDYKLHAAKTIVEAIFNKIRDELIAGEPVQIFGLGTLSIRDRAEHQVRNPRTGELMKQPASKRVHFTTGKALREALNR